MIYDEKISVCFLAKLFWLQQSRGASAEPKMQSVKIRPKVNCHNGS